MSAKAKKTNRVRNIIIAAAVIAVLAAAYFAVSALNRPEAPAPVQQQGDMMIAEFDASKIKEIKYTYNGEVRTPEVTVKDGTAVLEAGKDYTVAFADGRQGDDRGA